MEIKPLAGTAEAMSIESSGQFRFIMYRDSLRNDEI